MDQGSAEGAADVVAALLELLRRFEAGEVTSAALQVRHSNGTVEEIVLGFTSDQERDEAIAKLRRMLGQLH